LPEKSDQTKIFGQKPNTPANQKSGYFTPKQEPLQKSSLHNSCKHKAQVTPFHSPL